MDLCKSAVNNKFTRAALTSIMPPTVVHLWLLRKTCLEIFNNNRFHVKDPKDFEPY